MPGGSKRRPRGPMTSPASPRHHGDGASTPPPGNSGQAGYGRRQPQREDVAAAGGKHGNAVLTPTATAKRLNAGAAGVRTRGAGTGATSTRKRGGSVPATPKARKAPRKARGCLRQTCGWVSSSPGVSCSTCPAARVPEERMHEDGQRLCFACHRPACNEGFAHLDPRSVETARNLVIDCQGGDRTLPAGIIRGFRPNRDCYCRRPDCFYALFRAQSKKGARKTCHACRTVGRQEKRWYKVSPGNGSGAVKWVCQVCYSKDAAKKRGREHLHTVKWTTPGNPLGPAV